jgi:carbamoyl-phosphate synthase large subunit
MKTILVSGASGIVGYGILNSLKQSDEEYRLIGTTIHERSVAPIFCNIFELAPKTSDSDYLDWLLNIIEKYQVNMIIPGIEADMFFWNNHRDILEKTGVFPLLNNSELINLCSNKLNFYEKLVLYDTKYAIPTFSSIDLNILKMPFLLKPIRGYASKGIVKITDIETLDKYKDRLGTVYMAQPIIGTDEEEYSVSAFFDINSKLIDMLSLRRKLSIDGFTQNAEVVFEEQFKEAILDISKIFIPVGPTNFQFRLTKDSIKLLEINPRISSATSIRTAFGYNESKMSIEYFLNNKIPIISDKRKGYAVRYTADNIFYDSDNI